MKDTPIAYVALLRGINVSGQKLIKMEYLREVLSALPLQNIRTYIQSGNILFESFESDKTTLQQIIQDYLQQAFGYSIPVILRTIPEIKAITHQNPYGDIITESGNKFYVTFLAAEADVALQQKLLACNNQQESFQLINKEVYCLIRPSGTAKVLYSNNFIEKILKVPATTRNWATVQKLTTL